MPAPRRSAGKAPTAKERAAREKARREREAAEAKMTPAEYAAQLPTKWATHLAKQAPNALSLSHATIFFVDGDQRRASQTTRAKLDIVRKND